MTSVKKNNFCNNCGKIGHLFHQCKIPITSIGIIAIRKNKDNIEILLVRRKDSIAFVDFMRGKYNLDDKDYIVSLFERMSISERNYILNNDFETLWKHLWGSNVTNLYKNEEKISRNKFNEIKNTYFINNDLINFNTLIGLCKTQYKESEWGFPKGRRNYQERDIMCGIREFEEETGYDKSQLINFTNILPLEEIFTGSNYKSYKHKYFLAYIDLEEEPKNKFQMCEISKLEWVNIDDAKYYFREYNIEKLNLLNQLNKLLKTNKLYI